ncbi:MAG: hypothetical protein R2691_06030 [Solirubrobacterales bacterium]
MNPPPEHATLDPKQAEREAIKDINQDYKSKFGFNDPETGYIYKAPKGLSRELVEDISEYKDEPQWMREFRLKALEHFLARPVPQWGANLNQIDFDDIHYFVRASEKAERSWDDVPDEIKKTFDRLGIPEAERDFLAGVGAQYESEVVYHQVRKDLEDQGVQFLDMDSGLREHEEMVHEHFASVIPPTTTCWRRSTRRSGRAARSSTCRRASRSRCRCRPTSGSTPRTWASSSGR